MIISHKYQFVFLKTLKTAGTSIEVYLSQHCSPDDVVTPIHPYVAPHQARNADGYYNHIPAADVRARLGDLWHRYFKFCVERNPWDKTLSFYHQKKFRRGGRFDFDEFLAEDRFPVDHRKYTEPGHPGRIIVDEVLRYEELLPGLQRVFDRLGIPFSGSLGVNAKSGYRLDRRPYREVYTASQAARVADAFARECELFGYRF